MEGFEEEFDPRSKAYLRQGSQLDVSVPLTRIWILLCGNITFAHCRDRVTPDYKDAGKNWKGANRIECEAIYLPGSHLELTDHVGSNPSVKLKKKIDDVTDAFAKSFFVRDMH